jgi:hypothetical protein
MELTTYTITLFALRHSALVVDQRGPRISSKSVSGVDVIGLMLKFFTRTLSTFGVIHGGSDGPSRTSLIPRSNSVSKDGNNLLFVLRKNRIVHAHIERLG